MFDPALSVATVFEVLGIDAVLDPDGLAVAVRVVPSSADDVARFGEMDVLDETGVYEIRAADFAGHGDGAILEIAGARRRVQSHRVRDARRLKVVLNTVAAG